jgi:hypothetical protein
MPARYHDSNGRRCDAPLPVTQVNESRAGGVAFNHRAPLPSCARSSGACSRSPRRRRCWIGCEQGHKLQRSCNHVDCDGGERDSRRYGERYAANEQPICDRGIGTIHDALLRQRRERGSVSQPPTPRSKPLPVMQPTYAFILRRQARRGAQETANCHK